MYMIKYTVYMYVLLAVCTYACIYVHSLYVLLASECIAPGCTFTLWVAHRLLVTQSECVQRVSTCTVLQHFSSDVLISHSNLHRSVVRWFAIISKLEDTLQICILLLAKLCSSLHD